MATIKTKERFKLTEEIKTAARILAAGGVVVFPTDTVYGVGAKFDDEKALAKIHKIKGTLQSQDMPVLIDDKSYLKKLGCRVTPAAAKLIDKFWPGALTVIFNSKYGKIGLRIPNHLLTLSLIKVTGFPITGTSANLHGNPAPKKFADIDKNFIKRVDFVLKGKCTLGIESTIIDATKEPVKILRMGAVRIWS